MALKLVHREAEALEARALSRNRQRETQLELAQVKGALRPPPETDLLGVWQLVEVTLELEGEEFMLGDLEDELLAFHVLSSEGHFIGQAFSRHKSWTLGIVPQEKLLQFDLQGEIAGHGKITFLTRPPQNALLEESEEAIVLTHNTEAEWRGHVMTGASTSEGFNQSFTFRAVRIE